MKRIAERFPSRKYAVVDFELAHNAMLRHLLAGPNPKRISVYADGNEETLGGMIRKRKRTKNLNWDMPNEFGMYDFSPGLWHEVRAVMKLLPMVLLPNGKLYMTTEYSQLKELIERDAPALGLGLRIGIMPPREAEKRTEYTNRINGQRKKIYKIELTYRLKQAYPRKSERRKLTGQGVK